MTGVKPVIRPILTDKKRPATTPNPMDGKRQKTGENSETTHQKGTNAFRMINTNNFEQTSKHNEEEKRPKEEVKSVPVIAHYREKPFDEHAKTSQ